MLKCFFNLNFEKDSKFYYNILKEENFNSKKKNIIVDINILNSEINLNIICKNIIGLKIATNSIINTLDIINKTRRI